MLQAGFRFNTTEVNYFILSAGVGLDPPPHIAASLHEGETSRPDVVCWS